MSSQTEFPASPALARPRRTRGIVLTMLGLATVAVAIAYAWHVGPFLYTDDWAMFGALASGKMGTAALAEPWLSVAGWHYFRPVAALSLQADFVLFGANPSAMHWTNFAVFVLCAATSAWLVSLSARTHARAAGAAAFLFVLLHPGAVESVAWLSCRANLLSGLFSILACCCAVLYLQGGRAVWFAFAALSMLLGMFAKEDALVSAMLVVLIAWTGGRSGRAVALTVGAMLATIAFWAIRMLVGHPPDLSGHLASGDPGTLRLAERLLRHLSNVFWPRLEETPLAASIGIVGLVTAVVVLGWRSPHRGRWLSFALLVVVSLAPAAMADAGLTTGARTLFIPTLIAACLFGVAFASSPFRGRGTILLAVLLIPCAVTVTVQNLRHWRAAGEHALRVATALRTLDKSAPSGETFVFVDCPRPDLRAPSIAGAVASMLGPPFTTRRRPAGQGPERLIRRLLRAPQPPGRTLRAVAWSDRYGLQDAALPLAPAPDLFVWRDDALRLWTERTAGDRRLLASPPIGVSALDSEHLAVTFAASGDVPADAVLHVETSRTTLTSPGIRRQNSIVFPMRGLAYATPVECVNRLVLELPGPAASRVEEIRWVSRIPTIDLEARCRGTSDGKELELAVEFGSIREQQGSRLRLRVFDRFGELFQVELAPEALERLAGGRVRWRHRVSRSRLDALGARSGTVVFFQLEADVGRAPPLVLARSGFAHVELP